MISLRTTIEIVSGLDDYEVEIDVEYRIHPGDIDAEIEAVTVIANDGTKYPAPWLADMLADDNEILSRCLDDADERAEDAAEYRAEAKREARLLGDDQ